MVTDTFTYLFIATIALTLGLFMAAEFLPPRRNQLAAFAALAEAAVFALICVVFYNVDWGTVVPPWVMACLPMGGVAFSINMAHKRFTGRIL